MIEALPSGDTAADRVREKFRPSHGSEQLAHRRQIDQALPQRRGRAELVLGERSPRADHGPKPRRQRALVLLPALVEALLALNVSAHPRRCSGGHGRS